MSRSFTQYIDAELAKPGTKPFFIAKLGFSTTLYLSSRGPTTWNGNVYQATYLQFGSISMDDFGLDSAIIRLANFDGALSQVIYSEGVQDKPAELHMLHGDGPWGAADTIPLLIGEMDHAPNMGSFVDIQLIRPGAATWFAPQVFYEHSNILPSGTQVTLAGNTVTIGG